LGQLGAVILDGEPHLVGPLAALGDAGDAGGGQRSAHVYPVGGRIVLGLAGTEGESDLFLPQAAELLGHRVMHRLVDGGRQQRIQGAEDQVGTAGGDVAQQLRHEQSPRHLVIGVRRLPGHGHRLVEGGRRQYHRGVFPAGIEPGDDIADDQQQNDDPSPAVLLPGAPPGLQVLMQVHGSNNRR